MSITDRIQNDGMTAQDAKMKESLTAPSAEKCATETPRHDLGDRDHYGKHPSGVECIEITRHMNFNLGNVVKYLWREGLKPGASPVEDLVKARWYLDDEIKKREAENEITCKCGWAGKLEQRVWHRNGVQLLCPRCNKDL